MKRIFATEDMYHTKGIKSSHRCPRILLLKVIRALKSLTATFEFTYAPTSTNFDSIFTSLCVPNLSSNPTDFISAIEVNLMAFGKVS